MIHSVVFLLACVVAQDANPADHQNTIQSIANRPWVLRGQPVPIFDGKTLDGWNKRNGKNSKNWVVENGTLFRKSRGGDLYHAHWYREFELSFEWKLNKNGNSGLKYRVQDYGKQSLGCEYQIQDDKGKPFHKHATGALYAVYEPNRNKTTNPVGEWNRSKIVVCGGSFEHWLNGKLVVSGNFGSQDWRQRIASSKFKDKPMFGENLEGRIFLQDHGNPVWFRQIVVTPLRCELPTN